jgi:hypothetical protein
MNVFYRFFKNRLKRKQGITEEKEVKIYDTEEGLINFAVGTIQHKTCKREQKNPHDWM